MTEAVAIQPNAGPAKLGMLTQMGGHWASQQFHAHGLSPSSLRMNATLMHEEWKHISDAVVLEARQRLRAVQDLIDMGLTRPIPNAMGRTEILWHKVTDEGAAQLSMSPVARGQLTSDEFTEVLIPNPIAWSDFQIDLRKLEASRQRDEPLDTTLSNHSTRRVVELLEDVLIGTTGFTANGNSLYGYTNHPDRNTVGFGAGGAWAGAKTGAEILVDVLTLLTTARADRYFGPYVLYVAGPYETKLDDDFKTTGGTDMTIRQRIENIESISSVRVLDRLAAGVLLVQMTSDVVELADGESVQPVQWDSMGGLLMNFKIMGIQVPIVKSTAAGRSGVVHMS